MLAGDPVPPEVQPAHPGRLDGDSAPGARRRA